MNRTKSHLTSELNYILYLKIIENVFDHGLEFIYVWNKYFERRSRNDRHYVNISKIPISNYNNNVFVTGEIDVTVLKNGS